MRLWMLAIIVTATHAANAQLPSDDWEFEDGYRNDLLYVHALSNYAWDLETRIAWERQQFNGSALRVNTGSVSSDRLFTDVNLSINEQLNARWRFVGRFDRNGERRRTITTEQLQLGFERVVGEQSGVFVTLNPQYNKSFMDLAVGFATYRNEREHYARIALLLRDFNFDSKNDTGGEETQQDIALQWQVRWPAMDGWTLYSEGSVGAGFERQFEDATALPELLGQAQQNNEAELRLSRQSDDGTLWSVWGEWSQFNDAREFRSTEFNYVYDNTEWVLAGEHIRQISDKHRLRITAGIVDRTSQSVGFRQHDYDRTDILAGAFYEYLRPNSGFMLGYSAGSPDFQYAAVSAQNSYSLGEFSDKIIAGFRYTFSNKAILRASISQEFSQRGFGGGAVQYQMFF